MSAQVKRFDEINITPLTDIFLVLLIIMMVVAPAISQNNQTIETPTIQTGEALNKNLITVDIAKEGELLVQGESLADSGALSQRIEALLPTVTEAKVIIRADKATQNRQVLDVMKAVAATGVERIIFEGQQAKGDPTRPDVEYSSAAPVVPVEGEA